MAKQVPLKKQGLSGVICGMWSTMHLPEIPWMPISRPAFIAWMSFYGLILLYLGVHFSQPTWLDNVHLVVHEAGHLLFHWFGATLELWGGTIFQLLVPALLAAGFAVRGDLPGTTFCAFAFFHSLSGVAAYMSDALLLQLPLVTVGAASDEAQHDWVRIFTSLGVLPHAIQIGNSVRLLSWCGLLGTTSWFAWRYRRQSSQ